MGVCPHSRRMTFPRKRPGHEPPHGQRLGCGPAPSRRRERLPGADSWEEYAAWHLGLTEGAADGTKARYAFVYGDLRRVHRTGLIACVYRASEWRHKQVELAAHDLLQYPDEVSS